MVMKWFLLRPVEVVGEPMKGSREVEEDEDADGGVV